MVALLRNRMNTVGQMQVGSFCEISMEAPGGATLRHRLSREVIPDPAKSGLHVTFCIKPRFFKTSQAFLF